MFSLTKVVVLLSIVFSTTAISSPGMARSVHHRAVAARVASPAPANLEYPGELTLRKRATRNRRCTKPKSSSMKSSKTAKPMNTPAPANAAPAPPAQITSSKKAAAQSSAKPRKTVAAPQTPTTTKKVEAQPTPKSSNSGNQPSYLVGTQTGDATYYDTGLGACGITNSNTDYIAAVSHLMFDTFPGYKGGNPNNNPLCGRKVTAHYKGNTVTVALTDRCTGCALTDLDFSPAAYQALGPVSEGRLHGMTWTWN